PLVTGSYLCREHWAEIPTGVLKLDRAGSGFFCDLDRRVNGASAALRSTGLSSHPPAARMPGSDASANSMMRGRFAAPGDSASRTRLGIDRLRDGGLWADRAP